MREERVENGFAGLILPRDLLLGGFLAPADPVENRAGAVGIHRDFLHDFPGQFVLPDAVKGDPVFPAGEPVQAFDFLGVDLDLVVCRFEKRAPPAWTVPGFPGYRR